MAPEVSAKGSGVVDAVDKRMLVLPRTNRQQRVEERFGQRQEAKLLLICKDCRGIRSEGTDCDQRPTLFCPAMSGPKKVTEETGLEGVDDQRQRREEKGRKHNSKRQRDSGDPATLERA